MVSSTAALMRIDLRKKSSTAYTPTKALWRLTLKQLIQTTIPLSELEYILGPMRGFISERSLSLLLIYLRYWDSYQIKQLQKSTITDRDSTLKSLTSLLETR